MADQLGLMSDHMLQIVRSAFEEEQSADAIEALNDAFIQGQLPSRQVFYALLAVINGAPDFERRSSSIDAALHRKIGRFEWEDVQPSIVVASMALVKRYVAVNPGTVAKYLSPEEDEASGEGWLSTFSIDGSSGSDSDDPEGAPLIPILRLASTMNACDDVWQMLALPVPMWTENGGLTGSPDGRKNYAMLHEGDDFDEEERRKNKTKKAVAGDDEKKLQRVGSWRLLDIFLMLWSRRDSVTTDEDHFADQLRGSNYGKGRRKQGIRSGRVAAIELCFAGLSCGYDWEVPRDESIAPASAACKLFELLAKRSQSATDRDLIAEHIASYCCWMSSKCLETFVKISEDAEQLTLLGALRHLNVCGKNWEVMIDEVRLQKAVEAVYDHSGRNLIIREILDLARKTGWMKVPTDWTSIERSVIEGHEEEGDGPTAWKSTQAILDSSAWALQPGTEARSTRTRTRERKSNAGGGHGMLPLVEATGIRLETVGCVTRRVELQAYVCDALFRNVDEKVGSTCAEAVCNRGSTDLAALRKMLERMRPSLSKLVNDSLRVTPPSKFARKGEDKRPQRVLYISSDDDSSGVEEVHVPADFISHMKQCKASLVEMTSLLDHAEARLETLELRIVA